MEMAWARVERGTESNPNIVLMPWIMRRGTCSESFCGMEAFVREPIIKEAFVP